jgi:pantoate--beta-alanine ligase
VIDTVTTVAELRALLDHERCADRTVGLVPTMGALHDGHASLVVRAAEECDLVCVTVFVNPLQFAAHEDLDTYPRDLEGDCRIAAKAGAGVVFAPSTEEMYGAGAVTNVHVDGITAGMEGASRPTHFDGVATVVTKLFGIAGACRAYFGEKDYQQLAMVRRLASDLSLPVEVVGCPTVRERDGLALSSRNVYLTAEQRAAAPVLFRALQSGAAVVMAGEREPAAVRELMAGIITAEPLVDLDYAEVRAAGDLAEVDPLSGELRLLVAARLGSTRLLDNLGVTA